MSPAVDQEIVLVVDDDPGMRETLVEILTTNGLMAEGADSAAAAVTRAAVLGAAAAVVDQRLPDSNGIELCGRLKDHDPDLQAILLTGYATLETAIAAVGHLDEFLTKPVAPEQLVRTIRAALARRRLRKENALLVGQLRQANLDLEDGVAERNRELRGLTEMAEALSRATGLDQVTRAVAASVVEITGARSVGIYLSGDGRDRLVLAVGRGTADFPPELAGWRAARRSLGPAEGPWVLSDLAVGGKPFGLLALADPQLARRQLLATVATQAALAIQNAQRLDRERETIERLEELSRLKSAFLASVSHELRTPLAALIGFSEVLEARWRELPPADVQHILGRMVGQGERLRRLIENLLDSTSLEMGTLRVRLGRVDVAAAVRKVVDTHAPPGRLVVQVPGDLPPVTADESRFEQVLVNLLDNAVRHAGQEQSEVTVTAKAVAPDQVEVSVADQGPGIDPAFLPRLFDAFSQAADPDRHPGGVGLGLHITRGIVEAMGGSIGVESEPGAGTTFWFRLGVADAA